jgi:hypothetical protein
VPSLPVLRNGRKSKSHPLDEVGLFGGCYHRPPLVKLLLLSILIATFVLPVLAARVQESRRALLSLLLLMFASEVCYAVFLVVFYRRFG